MGQATVTGEQVCRAMVSNNITRVDHHKCSICGEWVCYVRQAMNLYFDPGCGCMPGTGAVYALWQEAADWINMQSNKEAQNNIKSQFGMAVEHIKD